jgi:hypothetical protein
MQDRKRLLSLPIVPEPPHSNNPNLPPLPPNPPSGAAAIIQSTSSGGHSSLKVSRSRGSTKYHNLKLYLKTF